MLEFSMHTVVHTAVDIVMHRDSMSVHFSGLNMHVYSWEKLREMLLLNPLLLMFGFVII